MTQSRPKALVLVAVLLASVVAPAAMAAGWDTSPGVEAEGVDTSAEKWQGAYLYQPTEEFDNYDRSTLDDPTENLQIHNDSGKVVDLEATVNDSQDEPVGVNLSVVHDRQLVEFPRVDGESENAHTWANASNWTVSSSGSKSGGSVSESDVASGNVDGVLVSTNGSISSTQAFNATFKEQVNISEDVSKRVLRLRFDVTQLDSGANVSVRLVDADGDYFAVYVDDSNTLSNNPAFVANGTDKGLFVQVRLSNAHESGTVDEIQKVRVVSQSGDATVRITGLDVESKSKLTLGTTRRDTDGDGDEEDVTLKTVNGTHHSGVVTLTQLDSMGSWASDATIHNLEVYDVRYSAAESTHPARVDVENASGYASYPDKLNASYRLEAPNYIDVTHVGTFELRADVALVGERYVLVEYATGVGSTDLGNVSDSQFTEATSYYSENSTGDTITLTTGFGGDTVVEVHQVTLHPSSEVDAIMGSGGAAMGPGMSSSSGGFLATIWGKVMAIVSGLAGALGLKKSDRIPIGG